MGIDVKGVVKNLPEIRKASNIVNRGLLGTDPQRNYMWEISILGRELNQILGDISFYAKTVSIPQDVVDTLYLNYMGNKIFFPGKDNSTHTLNLTFWDDENLTVYKYFRKWMHLVKEPGTGRSIAKKGFVSDIKIKLKDHTDFLTNLELKMVNCFPTELNDITLTYDSGDAIEIPIVLYFDFFEDTQ